MAVQPDLSKTWSETKLLVLSRDDSVLLRIGIQVLVFRPNVSYFLFINVYRSEGTTESKGVRGPFVNAPTAIAHTHTHTHTHTQKKKKKILSDILLSTHVSQFASHILRFLVDFLS